MTFQVIFYIMVTLVTVFERCVTQGDPLSPYLFILCVELLSAALKAHPEIQGLVINNSEYLISQYADDSTLILGDDEKSLNMALHIMDYFAGCSGLRANFDKTHVLWFGAVGLWRGIKNTKNQ